MVEKNGDREVVRRFCDTHLQGERFIAVSQHQDCEIAVVVPVRGEHPERIRTLIRSLAEQTLSASRYELILVVNGSVDDVAGMALNREVLRLGLWATMHRPKFTTVFAVDKNTPGAQFDDCNVGRARNRGVAEAIQRFLRNGRGKDGIIIQTDSDAWFHDETYLTRVIRMFEENPRLVAAAGGIQYKFSPDGWCEEACREAYWRNLVRMKLLKRRWQFDPEEGELPYVDFSGANMMSRAFATGFIGNVENRAGGEDTSFAMRMHEFAKVRGLEVRDVREEFHITTALRESPRTPVNFKCFREGTLEEPLVEDPRDSNFKEWWRKECPDAPKEAAWRRWTAQLPLIPLRKLWRELLADNRASRQFVGVQKIRVPKEFLDPTGKKDFSFLWND